MFVGAASRAAAEPLHPSPRHRALAAQPREQLQQRLLSLLAVYTALSLSCVPSAALPRENLPFRCGYVMPGVNPAGVSVTFCLEPPLHPREVARWNLAPAVSRVGVPLAGRV